MDSNTHNGEAQLGKRRAWSKREEEALLDGFHELCSKGWKADNGIFKPGYIGVLEKHILETFPGTSLKGSPHIESKIKAWKKNYGSIYSALKESGFSWNDTHKCLEVESDNAWENYLKKDKNAKGIRNKSFPYYDQWCLIFGKDRATGEMAEGPADTAEEVEHEEVDGQNTLPTVDVGLDDIDASISVTQTPTNKDGSLSKGGRKRIRNSDLMVAGVSDMAKSFNKFFSSTTEQMAVMARRFGYEHDVAEARKRVYEELEKIPNLSMDDILTAGSLIVHDTANIDFFNSLPEHVKPAWVAKLLKEHH